MQAIVSEECRKALQNLQQSAIDHHEQNPSMNHAVQPGQRAYNGASRLRAAV
jgi:hypothetical protein